MADADDAATACGPDSPHTFGLDSTDLDQARAELSRFFHPLAVSSPDGRDRFGLRLEVIQLGPLTVGELRFAGRAGLLAADLTGYHVTLPTAGRVLTRQDGHEVVATPATAAIFRPGTPVTTWQDARTVQMDVKIDGHALETELAALLGHDLDGPIDLRPTMDLATGAARSWCRLVRLLRAELPHRESLIYRPLIAEQVRHSLLSGLLLSVPHRFHAELTRPARPGPPRAIQRVVDAIHDEPERAFTVADLATVGGMSVRSLQEGFRRHIGCTPMSHLQDVRLARVHEALRQADPARITVATVAHRWGFAHLGRFASAYRARFGESPSQTLRGT